MRIALVNGFGHTGNVGDLALLQATVHLLLSAFPDAAISVIPWQRKSPRLQAAFDRLTDSWPQVELTDAILPAPFNQAPFPFASSSDRAKALAYSLWVNISSELRYRLFLPRRGSLSSGPFRGVDLVVLRGCNIVQRDGDLRALASVRRVTFPMKVAQRLGIPTVLMNFSAGPLDSRLARAMVASIVRRASFVSTREELTLGYLRQLTPCAPVLSADAVFALPFHRLDAADCDPMLVGLNVLSRAEYLATVGGPLTHYDALLERLATELNCLMARVPKLRVLGIPHEADMGPELSDRNLMVASVSRLSHPERMSIASHAASPEDVVDAYARCAVALGMRFHGFVLASLAGTPMLGIDINSRKARGVARSLGVETRMVDLGRDGHLAEQVAAALADVGKLRTLTVQRAFDMRKLVFDTLPRFASAMGAPQ